MKIAFAGLALLLILLASPVSVDARSGGTVSERGGWGMALKNPAGSMGNDGYSDESDAETLSEQVVGEEEDKKDTDTASKESGHQSRSINL